MNISAIAPIVDKACYALLALNFLWGLYCIITSYRRLSQFGFRNREESYLFVDELCTKLEAQQYNEAVEQCEGDIRALPLLAHTALTNRHRGNKHVKQLV